MHKYGSKEYGWIKQYVALEAREDSEFFASHGGTLASAACRARNIAEAAGMTAEDVEEIGQVAIAAYKEAVNA